MQMKCAGVFSSNRYDGSPLTAHHLCDYSPNCDVGESPMVTLFSMTSHSLEIIQFILELWIRCANQKSSGDNQGVT